MNRSEPEARLFPEPAVGRVKWRLGDYETVRGTTAHLAILDGPVTDGDFRSLLARCKGLGGWWRRSGRGGEGGFAFSDAQVRAQFMAID